MGNRLTGSALPRARHCAWPYRADIDYPQRPSSNAAEDGVETHSMLEAWLAGEEPAALGPRAQTIFEQVKAYFKGYTAGKFASLVPETAFAIDVETGEARVLGSRLKREYPALSDTEIALTVDWSGEDEVGDLKTGFAGHVAHPRENLQLLAAAYAVAKTSKTETVFAKILIAREDETVPLWAKLEGPEWMASVLAELREIHFRTRLPSPAVAGEHCSFCPALGACPQTSQMSALVGENVKWTTEFISTDNDARMVMHLPMLEKAIDAVRDALKTRGPVTLPNGKVWRETTSVRRVLDKNALEAIIDTTPFMRDIEVKSWRQMKP